MDVSTTTLDAIIIVGCIFGLIALGIKTLIRKL